MDHTLPQLNAVDIRDRLPRASWEIGRRPATTSITVHYNGPAVSPSKQTGEGLISQLIIDANWQMQPGWGGSTNGADGLMYHLVVAADGTIYQTRDLDSMLWHCGHQDGNTNGLALHLPLGDNQDATDVQWKAVLFALDTLRAAYNISFDRVVGHLEWKHATQCPGPNLMPRVQTYRSWAASNVQPTPIPANIGKFLVISPDALNVRQGPGMEFPIAGTLKPGSLVYVDLIKSNGWAHMARIPNEQADLGFVASGYLQTA